MGLERVVPVAPPSIAEISARLAGIGVVVMADNRFLPPGQPAPATWTDLRVKTPAGTVSIVRRGPDALAVVVFGNADAPLQEVQEQIAAKLSGPAR
jgi:hypothetical protein